MRTDGIRGRSPNSGDAQLSELGLRPRISTWYLLAAGAIVLQILTLGASPYVLAQPWDTLWHFLAYAALTLVLWIASDGRRPLLMSGAVMFLGACMADFAAAAPAAALTAGALFLLQGRPRCAESSPQ